jgi:hypothetical protein
MGVDARIYFEDLDNGKEPPYLSQRVAPAEFGPEGATHEVVMGGPRLYDIGYERGHWPELCGVLMELHASERVGRVWYDGDACDGESLRLCDPARVLAISAHYMQHGTRPYFSRR